MNNRYRKSQEQNIDISPLIDVVFLLLIFFMVSTTFKQTAELDLQLPEALHGEQARDRAPLQIEVPENGTILVNGEASDNLPDALAQFLQDHTAPERVVVIADERARHGQVTRVLDALTGAGLTQVSFQTRYGP